MTEISEDDARLLKEMREWEQFCAHVERYDSEGRFYKRFLGWVYRLFRECGMGAAATVEAGVDACKTVIRWMIWWAGVLVTQSGWLTKLVAISGAVSVALLVAVLVAQNWGSLLTLFGG